MSGKLDRKRRYYAVGSLVLGIGSVLFMIFNEIFITRCFPPPYNLDRLFLASFSLLISGGILLLRRSPYARIFFLLFAILTLVGNLILAIVFPSYFIPLELLPQAVIGGLSLYIALNRELFPRKINPV